MRMRDAVVLFFAASLTACSGPAVSNDPSHPIYRSDGFSAAAYQSVKVHFVSITTTADQAKDVVRNQFEKSFKAQLARAFARVEVGESSTGPTEAVLDVQIKVDWGEQAQRYLAGYGSGASIEMKYQLRDFAGRLLAKFEKTDSMSYTSARGDVNVMIQRAADEWNGWFVDHVLTKGSP